MTASTTTRKTSKAKATEPAVDETETPDLDVILPEDGKINIDGIDARVKRLKAREFLLLMRVITGGLGSSMAAIRVNVSDEERMVEDLLAMLTLAIPNAIDEFSDFVFKMVEAADPRDQAALAHRMENPDIDVLLDVLGILVEQEKDDLSVLAGKAQAWISRIQKTMQPLPPR